MANNPSDGPPDDFLDQILGFSTHAAATAGNNLAGNDAILAATAVPMMLQLSSGDGSDHLGRGGGDGGFHGAGFPLGLSLDQGKRIREDVVDGRASSSSVKNAFPGQPMSNTVAVVPHPAAIRPRVRAR
ncbi:basic helix-loop-helix (bHLH) DNA-binding superfamily protein [Actinidia rufa]|uniref:Basic helix-loop-helix (BHLH) DNA-binding superfamily protein n=1 Tax=Actinidia rufa TaxID=165716 RepID=A0A7J0H9F2_9ERIC|nr:basic helix-loop-helix (bHLH) DNA-binding superfamily protein [Actinidia rufa]